MNKLSKSNSDSFKKTHNVISPLGMPLCICEGVFSIGVAYNHNNWAGIFFAIIGSIILSLYFFAYFYFMIKDPSRLQSEEYNFKSMELALIVNSKSKEEKLIIINESIPSIADCSNLKNR